MRQDNIIHISQLLAVASAAAAASSPPPPPPQPQPQPQKVKSNTVVQLIITNRCSDTIWPAVHTDAGQGPSSQGFQLSPSSTRNFTVNIDWNGRVWGRTNCTFDSQGHGSCGTGDCGGNLTCTLTGGAATLAEFNLPGYMNQSFYDISLVDGYNLPLAIQAIFDTSDPLKLWPKANESNPSCVGSPQNLAPVGFNPYSGDKQLFLGTSSSDPLPFDNKTSMSDVSSWCPSDLLVTPSKDTKNLVFKPCLSACAKTNKKEYCCTGSYNSAKKCGSNYYSRAAKKICPDAYSFAFDDGTSTFAVPTGAGFEVIFCPGGRSTIIAEALHKGLASSILSSSLLRVLLAALTAVVVTCCV